MSCGKRGLNAKSVDSGKTAQSVQADLGRNFLATGKFFLHVNGPAI